ncbi:hypothetical protein [Mesorhizobium sp. B2-3-4]|uniref:hypothetical protein n=1 Tax=Mesorhizobium sp. B2-3-4 TaxID=2589959 RepID=UPI00112626E1|nr:hypothetical protein [Mesorhizobium sp. B2-3-4]TPM41629.1 hypothetical protein FJ967_01470 [Mesorhizobium sp. B2-3-4]
MKTVRFFFSFAILILASGFLIAPASAQATRTWVSGVGDDANPCSRTAPCKTFAGAISKTAPSGEINVLDPGGFGAVTITKSITIRSDHIEAGVLVSGTNGIIINAGANDKVVLEGLDIEGVGTGLNGVHFLAGKALYIIRCDIRHFTQNGVNSVSSTAGARVFIQDSTITQNNGGVNVQGNAVGNIAALNRVLVDGNTTFAIQATNAGNALAVANSVLNGSTSAIILSGGATATSFGPSNVVSGAGAFTTTNPFK